MNTSSAPQPDSPPVEHIVPQVIEDEMKKAYLAYSMSVIVSRALPDARDGLKPVHRRVLYGMKTMGLAANKGYRKCAKIVGEVMGNFHPHGDSSIYETLVRLAQDFNLRYPLVDGQGNFGSIDGDPPAAMRYTEARMKKTAEAMLADIDKKTVAFAPNFDGTTEEPVVLPSAFPNLLVNGSAGIAVGMATNMPPHNLRESVNAAVALLDNPEVTSFDLMQHIPGPDFPTGGIILGTAGIRQAYHTGRGKLVIRAKVSVEEVKNRQKLIVNEIPYQVNKSALVEEIAALVRDKIVVGISDIRDESDRDGIRVVFELKSGVNPDLVMNQLFSHSRLQVTFGVMNLALVQNQPRILGLKELLSTFIAHRRDVVVARTKFDLDEARAKAHILEGLLIALQHLDAVIDLIRKSRDSNAAKGELTKRYSLSDKQAAAVLDMRLAKLTSLESAQIKDEHSSLVKEISRLEEILASDVRIRSIIKQELLDMSSQFGDERKTQIIDSGDDIIEDEDLIPKEESVITLTQGGYVKRQALEVYKSQNRGGRGITATGTKEDDILADVFVANSHDSLLFFTSKGKIHMVKAYRIPESGRYARGVAAVNLVALEQGEQVTSLIPVKEFREDVFLMMVTKKGVIKKTPLSEFSQQRKGGKIAIGLEPDDELISAMITSGTSEILIATKSGIAVRFHERQVRSMGRAAYGVRGIKLRTGDEVVGAILADPSKTVLTVTEKGFGKRTALSDYRLVGRGSIGVINIKVTEKNGPVIGVMAVDEEDEIILLSRQGILIRISAGRISVIGRNTQGVRLMRLAEGDKLASASVVSGDERSGATAELPPQEPPQEEPAAAEPEELTEEPSDEDPDPVQ